MKKIIIYIILFVCLPVAIFAQRTPDILIDRYGRTISSSIQGREQTIIAQILLENGVNLNIEYYNGRVILAIIFYGDNFINADSFTMEIIADRTFQTRLENFNSISITADRGAFIDRASSPNRPPFGIIREHREGRYISKLEVILPNYKFDVIKYAQAFTVNISIGGVQRTFTAGNEEIRLLQDAGLIMSMAGLM